ncbi:hypothetical protein CDX27_08725 [Campylobacter coli]|nr:hypothetical protein [Campylobacter coli]
MKTKIILCSLLLALNANANPLQKSIFDDVFGVVDKKFDNLFSDSLSITETCYDQKFDFDMDFDICKIASAIDKLKIDSCKLIGEEDGKTIGISGAEAFCRSQKKEFSNYASKQAIDFAEYASINADDETKEFLGKLPNGQDVKSYLKTWDVNSILKDDSDTNIVSSYLKKRDEKVVSLVMEYAKTNGSKINPSQIQIEDIKAPANLEEYKKGINDSIRDYQRIIKDTNPNQISSLVRSKIQSSDSLDFKTAQEIVKENKKQFDLAKSIEIGQALSSNPFKKYAIPTQEYVETMRKDVQLKAIAEIREQQAYEIKKIAEIEEKYQKKYEIAKLLADKEVILAQKFDKDLAEKEIDEIIASVGN